MGFSRGSSIDTITEPELMTPGTDGIFDILQGDFTVAGDVDTLISNAAGAVTLYAQYFFSPNMNPAFAGNNAPWKFYGFGWEGEACQYCYVAAGQVVVRSASGAVQIIQTKGARGISVPLNGSITAIGVPLRTATGGAVTQASGYNDTTSPIIGYSLSGPQTGGSIYVKLKPLQ